jgi:Putative beta-barrel porin-2, OmpL-like. bbp2
MKKMKKMKKSTISRAVLAWVVLGGGSANAWADQLAQQPPAPAPAAAPPAAPAPAGTPPTGAPGAPGAPGPTAAAAPAAPAAPTSPLIGPALAGSLTIQLPPPKYTLGPLGDIYVDGVGSGLGQWQSNPFPGNRSWQPDLSNGQLFVQKTDGIFQFYAQGGAYSIATLGAPYISAAQATIGTNTPNGNLWGFFPMGFAKIVPTDSFSVQAGKLPSLIGAEDAFSFQNINIERGLLWNQEPSISKGGQANYTIGPVALSLSFNDGFDSGVWNWVSGSATYTINSTNTFVFSAGGNAGKTNISTLRTPLLQNNSSLYNLIYTYNSDPWIIQPYFQATHVPTNNSIGITSSASTFGGALLVNYDVGSGFNLGGRAEYLGTAGNNNLLFGPGSAAFSFTFTPSYQWRYYFARAEFSYVKAHVTPGFGLGPNLNGDSQTRVMVETGILF